MLRNSIIKRIIEKGGIIGEAAKFCLGDTEKMDLFIMDCSTQCHHAIMHKHFGTELVIEIEYFRKQHILKEILINYNNN